MLFRSLVERDGAPGPRPVLVDAVELEPDLGDPGGHALLDAHHPSGHSHAHPDIQQLVAGGPLFVNDGAVATGQRTPGERDYTGAFGWLVSVYDDRIEFSLRDFLERQWIEESHYVHDLP